MTEFTTRKGAKIHVVGDPALLTMDRIQIIGDRFDSDPRIASVSVHYHPEHESTFLRATAPAGVVIAIANNDLVAANEDVELWAAQASERGLWHDWWLTNTRDIKSAPMVREPSSMDVQERDDPSGSHFEAFNNPIIDPNNLTLTIDVTWLGPHETGAQVLTTAAIPAIANQPSIKSIRLIGLDELPAYAAHLTDHPKVSLATTPEQFEAQTDVIWYPNQIDQRVDISQARQLGKRVITTYLDLIAYDVPRYHGSPEGWAAYRGLQRKIALSVDGITTISKDVAKRLYEETPRLGHKRIQAIPLGLDHIAITTASVKPNIKLIRPFILVLGNDFQHKNRDFAIAVWQRVLQEGIAVDLVLAGLHVKGSSSQDSEKEATKNHVDLRGSIHTLGHVSSEERAWLLANAQAVMYPSSAEGFGFVPYEAAILGTPTTFTSFGPLAEISGTTSTPQAWNVDGYVHDLTALLQDPIKAEDRINQLCTVVAQSTWNHFAHTLVEFFGKISLMPTTPASALGSSGSADSAALAQVLSSKTWRAAAKLRRISGRK